jgi:glucose-1-phosphate thymidylyltransferase|tara:strand:- start:2125 stop:2988 length:864 start_codon:yes stop_codon:yes gene_type:complete
MKGIILAGGSGTRLYPCTLGVSKQLLPVHDKPMIYYSISILMLAGIREILIISTPHDILNYQRLLGSGDQFGVQFSYVVQETPDGLAQAFILGEEFIGSDKVCLILGDNLFWGQGFSPILQKSAGLTEGAVIFAYEVKDPDRFGIVEFDENRCAVSIEEKPTHPRSNFAVTGLYFYDSQVVELAKKIKPSERGEFEITSLNQLYLENGALNVEILGRGFAWLDTGTHDSLQEATAFIRAIENRQHLKVACLEEIALFKNWVTKDRLRQYSKEYFNSSYGEYLQTLLA